MEQEPGSGRWVKKNLIEKRLELAETATLRAFLILFPIVYTSIPPFIPPPLLSLSTPHPTNLITSFINIMLIDFTHHSSSLLSLSTPYLSSSFTIFPSISLNDLAHYYQRIQISFSLLFSLLPPTLFPFPLFLPWHSTQTHVWPLRRPAHYGVGYARYQLWLF